MWIILIFLKNYFRMFANSLILLAFKGENFFNPRKKKKKNEKEQTRFVMFDNSFKLSGLI